MLARLHSSGQSFGPLTKLAPGKYKSSCPEPTSPKEPPGWGGLLSESADQIRLRNIGANSIHREGSIRAGLSPPLPSPPSLPPRRLRSDHSYCTPSRPRSGATDNLRGRAMARRHFTFRDTIRIVEVPCGSQVKVSAQVVVPRLCLGCAFSSTALWVHWLIPVIGPSAHRWKSPVFISTKKTSLIIVIKVKYYSEL